jgi:hypothetical protein
MELLDRYLNSIRSCLPEAQRDDIVNELSENLHAQIEDKEAELGCPLSEAEVEAVLKQHGHPLVVASRFRQDQRSVAFGKQWIGPVLFPFYVRVLQFNLGLTSIIIVVILAALFASGQSVTVFGSLPTFLYQFLIQFGIITAIFAAADRHWTKFPDRWDPRNLKHPWHPAFAMQAGSKVADRSSRGEPSRVSWCDSMAQFVALGVSIVWLRVAQDAPFLIFGPAAAFIKPAPIWHQFYWPVVLLALAGMAQAGINLIRPDWIGLRTAYRIFANVGWLMILIFLLKAGNWVVLADVPGASTEGYPRTVEILNQCVAYALIGFGLVAAYSIFRYTWRLVRRMRTAASPAARNL